MNYTLTKNNFVVSQLEKFYDWNVGWGFDYIKKVLGVFDTREEAYDCGSNCGESFRIDEFEGNMLISSYDIIK